jgi:hypothetical protein
MMRPRSPVVALSAILFLLLSLTLTVTPSLAQDGMYRWVDEQGRVHYGQMPPSGVQAEQMRRASPPADQAAQERLQREMEARDERQQQARSEEEVRAEQEASRRMRQENCERARSNLETLTSRGSRVTLREGDQYRMLDEEERQAMIERTRNQIREFCDE